MPRVGPFECIGSRFCQFLLTERLFAFYCVGEQIVEVNSECPWEPLINPFPRIALIAVNLRKNGKYIFGLLKELQPAIEDWSSDDTEAVLANFCT